MEIQPRQPSTKASPETFTGDAWFEPIVRGREPSRLRAALVRFAPGARNAWHTHVLGQVLFVTEGVGRVQARGGEPHEIRSGDTIRIEPGEWHWHGAAPDHFMSHVTMYEAPPEGGETTWGDQVTEAEYRGAPAER